MTPNSQFIDIQLMKTWLKNYTILANFELKNENGYFNTQYIPMIRTEHNGT